MINITLLAHSRPRLLSQALRSLGDNDNEKILVLFDNPANREVDDILETWSNGNLHPNHQVCRIAESKGTGWARNAVISMSEKVFGRGEALYLSDDDIFAFPALFEKMMPIFRYAKTLNFKILAAYGHPYHIPIARVPMHYGLNVPSCYVDQVQAIALQSMLIDWETFDQYGPFTETPIGRVCMGEDVDFCHKILKDGGKLGVISPALVVNTGITNSFGEKIPGWEMVQKECPPGVLCE